jgi:hypothetical protein
MRAFPGRRGATAGGFNLNSWNGDETRHHSHTFFLIRNGAAGRSNGTRMTRIHADQKIDLFSDPRVSASSA